MLGALASRATRIATPSRGYRERNRKAHPLDLGDAETLYNGGSFLMHTRHGDLEVRR
jgi:hypothetical protein